VTVDGRPFATITVKNAGLGFTGARGVVLTAADQAALRALFTASIDLFATVVVLSEPALVLPGFASPVSRKTS